jgi:hypothetical protein
LGDNQYLKTIIDAINILNNHIFDKHNNQTEKHTKPKTKINGNNSSEDKSHTLSLAQLEVKCYCCGNLRHRLSDCTMKKKIPRNKWFTNKS